MRPPASEAAADLSAHTAIPTSIARGFCDALLRHPWDLPYIVVHAGAPGQMTHSGPYADEIAALLALDEISSVAGVTHASMAQLLPALSRSGEE